MTFKDRWRNYKSIGIFCIVFVLFLVVFEIWNILGKSGKPEINEEWVDISEFSNILEIQKEGKILSYPEVTVISEVDGEVMDINVVEGDIVDEWQNIMQIGDGNEGNEGVNLENKIRKKYEEYYEKKSEYDQFESEFGLEITRLENQLIDDNLALQSESESNGVDNENEIKQRIQDVNSQLKILKEKKDGLKSEIFSLESEINSVNSQSIAYYSQQEKYFPISSIQGVVSYIYVEEGDEVKNGDKLFTIINNNAESEVAVNLDFNEYILTKSLTGVIITTENENRGNSYYYGEIYTRSPVLNEEGEYTITIKFLEEVSDLILNDENTKITVYFTIDSESSEYLRIPSSCFSSLGKSSGKLILRDGDLIQEKEVGIKSKWNGWNNVEDFVFFSLEKEEEKDGIELCIDDWNKGVIAENDIDITDWYNQFETVEEFCEEYIKVNPMYGENRNLAIVPDLGGNGDIVEVLCRLD